MFRTLASLYESVFAGIKEIYYHRTRSLLNVLGITLGVGSLVVMMSIMEGFRVGFERAINTMGGLARVSLVELPPSQGGPTGQKSRGIRLDDMRAILANHRDIVDLVIPQVSSGANQVSRGGKYLNLWQWTLNGTTADWMKIDGHRIAEGRTIMPLDDASLSRVCVIGSLIRNELFDDYQNPIGEKILVNGIPFTVVGVFRHVSAAVPQIGKKADAAAIERDDRLRDMKTFSVHRAISGRKAVQKIQGWSLWEKYGKNNMFWGKNLNVLIPFSTFQSLFKKDGKLDSIELLFKDSAHLTEYVESVRATLKRLHGGVEDFQLKPWAERYQETNDQIRILSGVFFAIALISLVVGGMGVMNVILASIAERIREIGVRKSVGAGDLDIFMQFLVETVILSMLGGVLGIIVGIGLAFAIATLLGFTVAISPGVIVLALASSSGIGLIFGIYPALKAARLNPIQALRYE
ncbi:MAG: ABC transporter permease [Spirochaetes bacterium]|nr:ABC transporter permease [Spirochaetota bacterium]